MNSSTQLGLWQKFPEHSVSNTTKANSKTVGPTSTELLLALCCLLTVRSKALCDLESFMTLNLLDAEFRHCSFLVSYLFLIHFHFVYFSSVRWKILLGFLCRNRLLLTGTPIQNSMAEVCLMTSLEIFHPPPQACCLFSIYRFS